jgi:hypothetical protein
MLKNHADLLNQKEKLIVELHGSGEEDLSLIQARLDALIKKLADDLKISVTQLIPKNMHNLRPLRPNISLRNQQINRRLIIRPILAQRQDLALLKEKAITPAIVRANRDQKTVSTQGDFVLFTQRPKSGILEIFLRADNGKQATFVLPISAGELKSPSTTQDSSADQEQSISGKLPELKIGTYQVPVDALNVQLLGDTEGNKNYTIRLNPSINQLTLLQWHLQIFNSNKEVVFEQKGDQKNLASEFLWIPMDLANGEYIAYLKAMTSQGDQIQSHPLKLSLDQLF